MWELYALGHMHVAQLEVNEALNKMRAKQGDVEVLQSTVVALLEQVNRLNLVTIALTEIMQERLQVSPADIEAKLREIDERDGKLDGRYQPHTLKTCPACSRTSSGTRRACLYCGVPLPSE